MSTPPRRAVAVGGGTGLPLVLRCLLDLGFETTAIVTMADDGGSTGTLRKELGILPPGDIRNCLVALSDEDTMLARLFQYRFPQGEGLEGHAMGNLILAALADISSDFPSGIAAAADLLGARGRVLPSTLEHILLCATDANGEAVRGQANIARGTGPFREVHAEPASPAAYEPALNAISQADAVVIGPGSLFTSIVPNFLVDGMRDALRATRASRVYVCNVANQRSETAGMDAADHVEALLSHGLEQCIDVVLVHDGTSGRMGCDDSKEEHGDLDMVACGDAAVTRIESYGTRVAAADVVDVDCAIHHSRDKLARALREVL